MNIKLTKFTKPLLYKNKFKYTIWYLISMLFVNTSIPFSKLKIFTLRLFGAKIKKGVIINSKINVKFPWNLTIGNDCWIGNDVWIDNTEMVSIGNDCCISQGVYLVTGNHNFKKETFDYYGREIVIEPHSWIGAKSIICPGVTIKKGSFIKVGSVIK